MPNTGLLKLCLCCIDSLNVLTELPGCLLLLNIVVIHFTHQHKVLCMYLNYFLCDTLQASVLHKETLCCWCVPVHLRSWNIRVSSQKFHLKTWWGWIFNVWRWENFTERLKKAADCYAWCQVVDPTLNTMKPPLNTTFCTLVPHRIQQVPFWPLALKLPASVSVVKYLCYYCVDVFFRQTSFKECCVVSCDAVQCFKVLVYLQ